MSPADAVWYLGEDDRNPMVISAVLWFDRPMDLPRLRALLEDRLLDRHPVFRQRIVPSLLPLLLPRWEPADDFRLDDHLSVSTLPPPADHAILQQVCSEERSTPLDRDRPLWHVHVHQGYLGTGSAIHVRLHHSLADGLVAMRVLLSLSDEHLDEDVPLQASRTSAVGAALDLAGRAVAQTVDVARHPTHAPALAREVGHTARWAGRLLAPPRPPISVLLGRPGGRKRMVWDPQGLPLPAVKAYAHAHDATINDVVLSLMSGALRRYLVERAEPVDEALMTVPIDLRPPGGPLPAHLGNRIGLLPVLLPVGIGDPVRRLATVRDRMRDLKRSPAPVLSRVLLGASALATPVVERNIHRLNQARGTGVLTNVPGPRTPLHIAGARMEGVVGWGGMTASLNVNASCISLNGRLFAGLVTDEAITPDPDRILSHLLAEWGELEQAAAA